MMTLQLIKNRYEIVGSVGEGGMGTVYRAKDRLSGEVVALKQVRISPAILSDTVDLQVSTENRLDARLALAIEFRTLASLRHPHIINVLDYGFDGENPFFTMELLEDAPTLLQAAIDKTVLEKIRLVIQLLQALAYLHRRDVLHRDLKPANVLVTNEQIKVLDFGLAKVGEEVKDREALVGTLAYIAPELIRGEPPTTASDLYAVGLLSYELLVGVHPFDNKNMKDIISDILGTNPDFTPLEALDLGSTTQKVSMDIEEQSSFDSQKSRLLEDILDKQSSLTVIESGERPSSLIAQVIFRLLEKDPEERYRNANEVIADLSQAIGEAVPAESIESYLQSARFVGREQELNQLVLAFEAAANKKGSAWLVAGESGSGKSRLLEELRIRALVEGAQVLKGQAIAEGGIPYLIWRDVLRYLCLTAPLSDLEAGTLKALIPDIDDLLGRDVPAAPSVEAQAAQERLLNVIESLFRKQTLPTVIILEDLQWSSESLQILNRLSQIVSELPLLLVGNYRVEESPQLPQELPLMKTMRLNRLNEKDIAKLSSAMLGKAASQNEELLSLLSKESEGNVYFIVEVMKALAEEAGNLDDIAFLALPQRLAVDGIVALIERRLGRVPAAAQDLLELASIIGRQIDVGLLEKILSNSSIEALLAACGEAAILEVQDEQWRFAHDKLRESLIGRLPEEKRQSLHRHVATALESYKPDDSPALAYHWRQAGDIEKEAHYAYQAAQLALQSYAYSEAIAYLERSLELVKDADKRTEMQNQLAESYLAVSNLEKTIEYFEKTLASLGYRISHSPVILLFNITWEASVQAFHRFLPKSWFHGGDKARLKRAALIYQQLAEIFYTRLQVLESAYAGIRAANLAEKLGEENGLLALIYASMCILMSSIPWHRAARLYYRLSREIQTEESDTAAKGWAYLLNGLYDTATTDWENAQKNCLHGAELLKSVGHQRRWEMCLEQTGVATYMNGRYAESRAYYEQSLPTAKRRNDYQVLDWACFGILAGQVKQKQSDIWKMSHFAEEILPMSPGTAEQIYGYGVLAWAYWRQDDYIKGRENAEACLKRARGSLPFAFYNMEGYAGMCWVFLRLWEILPEDAALKKAAGQACFALRIFAMIYPLGKARYYLMDGLYLQLNGKQKAAQKRWEKALATAKAAKMPYDEGLAYFEMARHLEAGTKRSELFNTAREIFSRIDASYELEAIREYERNE